MRRNTHWNRYLQVLYEVTCVDVAERMTKQQPEKTETSFPTTWNQIWQKIWCINKGSNDIIIDNDAIT